MRDHRPGKYRDLRVTRDVAPFERHHHVCAELVEAVAILDPVAQARGLVGLVEEQHRELGIRNRAARRATGLVQRRKRQAVAKRNLAVSVDTERGGVPGDVLGRATHNLAAHSERRGITPIAETDKTGDMVPYGIEMLQFGAVRQRFE